MTGCRGSWAACWRAGARFTASGMRFSRPYERARPRGRRSWARQECLSAGTGKTNQPLSPRLHRCNQTAGATGAESGTCPIQGPRVGLEARLLSLSHPPREALLLALAPRDRSARLASLLQGIPLHQRAQQGLISAQLRMASDSTCLWVGLLCSLR